MTEERQSAPLDRNRILHLRECGLLLDHHGIPPSGADHVEESEWHALCDLALSAVSETVAQAKEATTPNSAEIRLNDDKTLDEVVTKDGDQLEQMDFNHWFLQIGDTAVWLHSKTTIRATYERRNLER